MIAIDTLRYSINELTKLFHKSSPEEQIQLIGSLSTDPRKGAREILNRHLRVRERVQYERIRLNSMREHEDRLRAEGFKAIAGVDEAGRGALAGPIVAGAVVLSEDAYIEGLKDSKKLSKERREELYTVITKTAVEWAAFAISSDYIDAHGIQQANMQALAGAVRRLSVKPDYVLSDALSIQNLLDIPCQNLIRGDSLSVNIAAASIIAKVTRDRIMHCLHGVYPDYDFKRHVGYGTASHFELIAGHGISTIHRKTFLNQR